MDIKNLRGSLRSDLKKLDSFTFETSKNHLIRKFLRNWRLRVKANKFPNVINAKFTSKALIFDYSFDHKYDSSYYMSHYIIRVSFVNNVIVKMYSKFKMSQNSELSRWRVVSAKTIGRKIDFWDTEMQNRRHIFS